MKTLSLLQPWATLVVTEIKQIETRSWNTNYRGKILIHASKGKSGLIFSNEPIFKKYISNFKDLPFGCIIGSVHLIQVVPITNLNLNDDLLNKLTMEEKAFGDYSEGRYAWILEEPIIFKNPIPCKGMISLWDFPESLLADTDN